MNLCMSVQALKAILDRGKKLPFPDGILINGRGPGGVSFNVEQGTISFKICQDFLVYS